MEGENSHPAMFIPIGAANATAAGPLRDVMNTANARQRSPTPPLCLLEGRPSPGSTPPGTGHEFRFDAESVGAATACSDTWGQGFRGAKTAPSASAMGAEGGGVGVGLLRSKGPRRSSTSNAATRSLGSSGAARAFAGAGRAGSSGDFASIVPTIGFDGSFLDTPPSPACVAPSPSSPVQPQPSGIVTQQPQQPRRGMTGPAVAARRSSKRAEQTFWVPDEAQVWALGTVISSEGEVVTLQVKPGPDYAPERGSDAKEEEAEERVVKRGLLLATSAGQAETPSDLTKLAPLNEPAVLHALAKRFQAGMCYTSAGSTMIAVNLFRDQGLYGPELIKTYSNGCAEELPPHIYKVAKTVYERMDRDTLQAIVVSGESGSGKTYSANKLVRYIAEVAENSTLDVAKRIVTSNPILEAFGNAMTVNNANSSRFGKSSCLSFDRSGSVAGAEIKTYLLEQTRVTQQAPGEQNFHIFYQCVAGASRSQRAAWSLCDGGVGFKYLRDDHGALSSPGWALGFKDTAIAMRRAGFDKKQVQRVFQVVAAILHLGNASFATSSLMASPDSQEIDIGLKRSAHLLGVGAAKMAASVAIEHITVAGESIAKEVSEQGFLSQRDGLAKSIYTWLFNWVVEMLNERNSSGEVKHPSSIILLDVFGFEQMQTNSLEQLCINYANEKLQQFFVKHLFKEEQQQYLTQGIPWSKIDFPDNQACLDLLEGRRGLFRTLNEDCHLNRRRSQVESGDLILKLHSAHQEHEHYSRPKIQSNSFGVHHYAGQVMYDTTSFTAKNRYKAMREHIELLQGSSFTLVKGLVERPDTPAAVEPARAARKKDSIVSNFKTSLGHLFEVLETCSKHHYIRCVSPNSQALPGRFDNIKVIEQLRACGVLESIKISALGLPSKLLYSEFLQRYEVMRRNGTESTDQKERALWTVQSVLGSKAGGVLYGTSKVFLSDHHVSLLEERLAHLKTVSAQVLQRCCRRFLQRQHVQRQARFGLLHLKRGGGDPDAVAAVSTTARRGRHAAAAVVTVVVGILQAACRGFVARRRWAEARHAREAARQAQDEQLRATAAQQEGPMSHAGARQPAHSSRRSSMIAQCFSPAPRSPRTPQGVAQRLQGSPYASSPLSPAVAASGIQQPRCFTLETHIMMSPLLAGGTEPRQLSLHSTDSVVSVRRVGQVPRFHPAFTALGCSQVLTGPPRGLKDILGLA